MKSLGMKLSLLLLFVSMLANAKDIKDICKGVHSKKSPVLWNIYVHGEIAKQLYTDFYNAKFPVSTETQGKEIVYKRMSANLLCARYTNPESNTDNYVCGVGFDGGGNARRPHVIDKNDRVVFQDNECTLSPKQNAYVLIMGKTLAKFAFDQTPIYFPAHEPALDDTGKYHEVKKATHLFCYQVKENNKEGAIINYKAALHISRAGLKVTEIGN